MFTACRRGTASLSKVARIPTRRLPLPRTLSLQKQCTTGHILELSRSFSIASRLRSLQPAHKPAPETEHDNPQPITRFDELVERGLVHPNVVRAITQGMGHETMTEVQTLTINEALHGTDIIAQARTGTGKTLGFLLPTIQNIIKDSPALATRNRNSRARASDIRAIIISPTRELAEQIAVEAVKLTTHTDIIVQVATGGNSKSYMLNKTRREGCHILVATPGRLDDLLSDAYSGIRAPQLKTLVLDEADRLLDEGFSKDIEAIMDLLPPIQEVDRQTMLFSATVPPEVMRLVRSTLKRDFKFVQTVKEGDVATHERIPQKIAIVAGFENLAPSLLELCRQGIKKADQERQTNPAAKGFKAIVYFNSTSNVELYASIFENLRGAGGDLFARHPLHPAQIFQIHGKLSQAERTRAASNFRRADSGILFSSDVTARGMDFPDVTHVIQIRTPQSQDQYIHRVGRTGRANKGGEGWILVHQDEIRMARSRLRGLPISLDKTLQSATVDMTKDAQLPATVAATLQEIAAATKMVPRELKVHAYLAELRQSPQSGKALNQWTKYGWGWDQPPSMNRRLAQNIGVAHIGGMNIQESSSKGFDNDESFGDGGFSDSGLGGRGYSDRGLGGGGRSGGRGYGDRGSGGRDRRQGRDSGRTDRRASEARPSHSWDRVPKTLSSF